jgi:hypothetical protein
MPIMRPFRRTVRQFGDGTYRNAGNGRYIQHPKYASDAKQYQRAFTILQKDFLDVTEYIEPAQANVGCYSYRTHELLMRACAEIEANFRAIYADNGHSRPDTLNMKDFSKLNTSHRLSSYSVKLPVWHGEHSVRKPFAPWATNDRLPWFEAYGSAKHNRHEAFRKANFGAVVDAICGCVVVLASQFMDEDFHPKNYLLAGDASEEFQSALGEYFLVRYPDDWPESDRYYFSWAGIMDEQDPFQNLVL